jgi:hypothetical protein
MATSGPSDGVHFTVTLRIDWHLFEKQVSEAEDEQLAAAELSVMGVGV